MNLQTLAVVALLGTPAPPAPAPGTWTVDPAHSEVSFRVRHLLSRTAGRFNGFSGTILLDPARLEDSSVEFAIETASVDTANADRDAHLRGSDFLDAAKHPQITFRSTKVVRVSRKSYDVLGVFTLRGVSRTLMIPVTYLGATRDPGGNERAAFELTTRLDRREFGLVWNQVLEGGGLVLGDDIEIQISLEAVRKKE